MLLKADQLTGHLARGLSPVYVLYGDEPLLTLEAATQIREQSLAEGFDEREVLTVLTGFDWGQLAAASSSLSLFGSRKLIDLRIPGGKPGREGSQALQRYAESPAPDTVLLVTLPELDWKEEKATWLQALGQAGVLLKLSAPPLAELPGWIASRLRRQHQKADREALVFMAERVEGNLLAAHQEIQKLGLLYPAGELSFEQIRAAVMNVARYNIDDLRDALLQADLARFVRTLDGLQHEGEAVPLVLWALTEEVRSWLMVREGMAQGQDVDAMLKAAKVWGARQASVKKRLQRLPLGDLREALNMLFQADYAAKGLGGVGRPDPWAILRQLGLHLIRPAIVTR